MLGRRSGGFERAAYPVQCRVLLRSANRNHVKPAGRAAARWMPLQPACCRSAESALLDGGDARQPVAPAVAGAIPHLDEHDCVAILEDEIKLAALLAEVLFQQCQALCRDQIERPGFRPAACFAAGPALWRSQSPAPVTSVRSAEPLILPPVMVPQASSLAIRPSDSSLSSPVLPSNTSSRSTFKRSVSR